MPRSLAPSLSAAGNAYKTALQHSFLFTSAVAILVPALVTPELATGQNTVILLPSSVGMDRGVQFFQGQEVGVEEGAGPE